MSILVLAGAIPYLLPTIVAAYRDHPNKTAIFAVDLCLGWIVAFVWAVSGARGTQPVAAAGDARGPNGLKLQGRDPRFDLDPEGPLSPRRPEGDQRQ